MVTVRINRNSFFFVRSFVRCPIVVRHSVNWSDMRKMAILHGTARVYANKQVRAPSLITFSIYNVHELCAAVQSRALTNCYGECAIFSLFFVIGLRILSYSIPRWTATANRQRRNKSIWFRCWCECGSEWRRDRRLKHVSSDKDNMCYTCGRACSPNPYGFCKYKYVFIFCSRRRSVSTLGTSIACQWKWTESLPQRA